MMANGNTSGRQPASGTPKAANTTNSTKANKSRVGGSAVPGAKSTAPKQISTTNNVSQQQAESYNRNTRRRMQHLGTGPGGNQKVNTVQDQRKKRVERRKQRVAEERERLRKATPTGKIALGNRTLYFIIGTVALVVLLIVVFAVLRATHTIQ